jgi:catecholate siderophore receptor
MKRSITIAVGCLVYAALSASGASAQSGKDTTTAKRAPATVPNDTANGEQGRSVAAPRSLSTVHVTATGRSRKGYTVHQSSSATKTDTPLLNTPQSVSIVTHALIADQAMQNMADVVRYIPGITMGQGEGHRDAPTIRGNSSTADFFVDGVRDDAQYYRDLYNTDRVEALKGSNAMMFGRGGGGGIINRVTKEADWIPVRTLAVEGGSYDHKRTTIDIGEGLSETFAARINGMYESSDAFRNGVQLNRSGINPTLAYAPDDKTQVHVGYEYFDDHRTVDRGIPSYRGAPSAAPISAFFGDPAINHAFARVHTADALIEHQTNAGVSIRNRTRFVHYDKFYQNITPGIVSDDGANVALKAYNSAMNRGNIFNQTDLTYAITTGAVKQTFLVGAELGRESTDNFKNTGYFGDDDALSLTVPFRLPAPTTSVAFRQSATDADNHVTANVGALYAQNQLELSSHLQAIVGLRFDRFGVAYHNNRNGDNLRRNDNMLSPRLGLIFKPVEPLSIYGSRTISFLPSSGDQFSSLTASTATLEPERFTNSEFGAKWDITPDLALTSALYRLDRTNTTARDPNEPDRLVQTGSERTTGFEFGASGNVTAAWGIAGGFAAQRAVINSSTAAAERGATVALVPRTTVSLWNKYQIVPSFGLGLGLIHQTSMYAAIDNTVTLPGFTRADGAVYINVARLLRAQINVENMLNRRYYATSQGNNNIAPGAPRLVRVSLATGF